MVKVLFYKDDPALFLSLLDREKFPALDPVSFPLWDRYHRAYFTDGCDNISFALIENDQATVIVPCQNINHTLRNNGAPVRVHFAPGNQTRQKTQAVMDVWQDLMNTHAITDLTVRTTPVGGLIDLLGDRLLKAGAGSKPLFSSQINLEQTETEIRQGLRKSYAPLINWGEKNIKIVYLDKNNPDENLFEQIRKFHIQVAGRVTRSEESWQIQYEMILAGCAELIIGYLDDKMVSAGFYMDEGFETLYGVGIYDRTLFEKPLAHYVTYQGIMRARARGQKLFLMGDVPAKPDVDDKVYQIGDFKKGFSPALTINLQWQLLSQQTEQA